jgi:hypothetical protein
MSKLFSFVVAAACLLAPTLGLVSAWAEGTAVRVRGTVVSLDGSKLVVHTKDGKDVTVSLKDKYAALAVVKIVNGRNQTRDVYRHSNRAAA